MSLSSLILRPEAGRYVIGAYLTLNTLGTALLTAALTMLLPETDPVVLFTGSFFFASLMVTVLFYSGFHERTTARPLKETDQLFSGILTPTLTEVSRLPFLQRSKDAFQGSRLLYLTLVLFVLGVISGMLLFLEPLFNIGAAGSTAVLSIFYLSQLNRKTNERKDDFFTQLMLSLRYFKLHLTLPENTLEQPRFQRLETQLGLGA